MATGMSFATTFVLTLVSALAWFFDNYLLVPYELAYLRQMVYIFASAVMVQLTEIVIRISPVRDLPATDHHQLRPFSLRRSY